MSFWTMEGTVEDPGDITLCESCALEATNLGIVDFADAKRREPKLFKSMHEAASILGALLATIGEDLGIVSRPFGTCDECGLTIDPDPAEVAA